MDSPVVGETIAMKFGDMQITKDMQLKIIYLAVPYTHPDPCVEHLRFKKVTSVAGMLLKEGYGVFSPITHGRPIAEVTQDLPTSADFWETLNKWMMRSCDEVWVLTLPGWQDSKGVTYEIDFAVDTSTPVHYITMEKGSWPCEPTLEE